MRFFNIQRAACRRATPVLPSRRLAHHDSKQHDQLVSLTAKWQPLWDSPSYRSQLRGGEDRKTAYVLPMFPYPSGTLHLGHLRVYTISDVLARFKRMQGYDTLHPIGWDAFGLPAENAAIERGISPEKWTLKNIDAMKEQMRVMGGRWDWDAVCTTARKDVIMD